MQRFVMKRTLTRSLFGLDAVLALVFTLILASMNVASSGLGNEPVVLISPKNDDSISELQPVLSWTDTDNPYGSSANITYNVYLDADRANVTMRSPACMISTGNAETTAKAMILKAGIRYYWRVEKLNMGTIVTYSEVWSFISGTNLTGSSVRISMSETTATKDKPVEFNVFYPATFEDSTTYSWDFGDGTTLEGPQYKRVVHAYASVGNYNVSVWLRDKAGHWAVASNIVNVERDQSAAAEKLPFVPLPALFLAITLAAYLTFARKRL